MGNRCCSGGDENQTVFRRNQKIIVNNDPICDPKFESENLGLSTIEAEARDARLCDVSYRVILNMSDSDQTGYSGAFRVTFGLKDGKWPTPDDPLFLDFQGKEISKVKVNQSFFGRESVQFEGHRVKLPS